MKHYIDKGALITEIEKMRDEAYPQSDWNHGYTTSCEKILSFLDTLETKDVDLEKDQKENIDLEKEVNQYFEKTWPFEEDDEDLIAFARYFFELGLIQKEE